MLTQREKLYIDLLLNKGEGALRESMAGALEEEMKSGALSNRAFCANRLAKLKEGEDPSNKGAGAAGAGRTNSLVVPGEARELVSQENPREDGWRRERYVVGAAERALLGDIRKNAGHAARLEALGIPYANTTLIGGRPGTGKTEFCRWCAYEMEAPLAVVQFSQLVGKYLGSTSANIARLFERVREFRGVLLLDEIDAIATDRAGAGEAGGATGEESRITITLLQEIDRLPREVVLIACTNRMDKLDRALFRRFHNKSTFEVWGRDRACEYIRGFEDSCGMVFDAASVKRVLQGECFNASDLYDFCVKRVLDVLDTENA